MFLLGDALPLHPPRDPFCCFCSHHRLHLFTPLFDGLAVACSCFAGGLLLLGGLLAFNTWKGLGFQSLPPLLWLRFWRTDLVSYRLAACCRDTGWAAAYLLSIVSVGLLVRRVSPGFLRHLCIPPGESYCFHTSARHVLESASVSVCCNLHSCRVLPFSRISFSHIVCLSCGNHVATRPLLPIKSSMYPECACTQHRKTP